MSLLTRRAALRRALVALAAAPGLRFTVQPNYDEEIQRMDTAGTPRVILQDAWPDRASYQPGATATLKVSLVNDGALLPGARLVADLHWLDERIATEHLDVDLATGDHTLSLSLPLPATDFRGYGVEISLHDAQGTLLVRGSTALDVLQDWRQAPRYGFVSDFAPGDPFAATNVDMLSRYHINLVQFYDWMWRHYALMPPRDEFSDGMGRELSLHTVREKVAACTAHGMAAFGYAAVYGAEPEYALKHPDEMLYDGSGTPYSIEKLFYVMNIHQGNPWRPLILATMAEAVREVPFDGLHLDQYGFPKDQAFGPPPARTRYDLSEDFPPFIDDARRAVRKARANTGVIFNAVDNWPIETVAPTTQDAVYIEVWPPFTNYSDLQTLILEARHLAPAKQVILAAYSKPLLGALGDALPPAEAATRLASAAIWANGGFHLLMGEQNGALCDAYYPKYATLMPDFARVMRCLYDFVVRYENVLSDRRLVTATGSDGLEAVRVTGAPASPFGDPGTVWTIARSMPGFTTVSLINLTSAPDANWNEGKPTPKTVRDLHVEFTVPGAVSRVFTTSPDGDDSGAQSLPFSVAERGGVRRVQVRLPRLEYWSLIVAQ